MSIKNRSSTQHSKTKDTSTKAMRSVLKQIHANNNGNNTITYNLDSNNHKTKLNQILKDKVKDNYKHSNKMNNSSLKRQTKLAQICNKNNNNSDPDVKWICLVCTYHNLSIMGYCEICEAPKPNQVINDCDGDKTMQDKENKENDCKPTVCLDDEQLAIKLQHELNKQKDAIQSITKQKQINDQKVAKQLQLEMEQQQYKLQLKNQQADELLAQRLQIEQQKELLKIERQKIENERLALAIQIKQDLENEEYKRTVKDKEFRMKEDEEFAQRLLANDYMNEKKVSELFYLSLGNNLRYKIIEIEDLSSKNADKSEIYEKIINKKCCHMNRESVEMYLWHGTKNISNLELILKNGFDRSYNTASAYGKGTYFAKDSLYSVSGGYCGKDHNNVSYILLCKVIIGDYCAGNKSIKTIPRKDNGQEYDSLVNNLQNPTIFVVWRDYHAIPAYLVKFVSN